MAERMKRRRIVEGQDTLEGFWGLTFCLLRGRCQESGHTNLRNPPDHFPADSQALDERPGRDKGPDHLCLHVPGDVTEGPQRLLLFGHTLEVFLRQAGLQGAATRSTGVLLLHKPPINTSHTWETSVKLHDGITKGGLSKIDTSTRNVTFFS